jgi:hypothetical protein
MLEQERQYYEENKEAWLTRHRDRFVLVKGRDLLGVYNTIDEAISEGARLFGLDSFLVRQVRPFEEEIHVPALALGILRADSTSSKPRP